MTVILALASDNCFPFILFLGILCLSHTEVAECYQWKKHPIQVFISGSTVIANRHQQLNFRRIEPVLHQSRWVEAVVKAEWKQYPERPIHVFLQWKHYYPVLAVEFQDVWTCLAFKSLSGREAASSIWCDHCSPSIYCQSTKDPLGLSLSGWITWISGQLYRSYAQFAECGSVQSSHVSSGITTRNKSVVESHSGGLNFRTIEPVLHRSRWVESVEEASILGMFPVEVAPESSSGWLDALSHAWIFEFQDDWTSLTSKL